MKRVFLLILAIFMLLDMVACSTTSNVTSKVNATTGGNNTVSDNVPKTEVKITAIGKGLGDEWLKQVAEDYTHETGIPVTVYPVDPNLADNMTEKMAGSSAMDDIYFTYNSDWIKWAATGKMADLTDLFNTADSETKMSITARFRNKSQAELGIYEGKRYYAPLVYPPTGLVYNKTYLKQLGYNEFPNTWEGLLKLCKDINSSNLSNNGTKVKAFSWGCTVDDLYYMFKALWYQMDPDGFKNYWSYNSKTVLPEKMFVNDATVGAMEAIYDLIAPTTNADGKGYSANSIIGVVEKDNLGAQESFINGYSVFCQTGSWFVNEMQKTLKSSKVEYGFSAYPKLTGAKATSTVINVPGEYFFIPSDAKNVVGAKAFLKYLYKEENLVKIQKTLQLPLSYNYYNQSSKDFINNLSGWAKDCMNMVDNSSNVVAGSSSMLYMSGALIGLKLDTNAFKMMAENRLKRSEIRQKIIIESYGITSSRWSDYIKNF